MGLFLAACAGPRPPEGPTILVTGPAVIGFFPPVTQAQIERSPGAREGMAHLESALADVARCLRELGADVRKEFGRTLVLESGRRRTTVWLPTQWPRSAGAVLVRPGVEPRVVSAAAAPSSLSYVLPNAAAEYFGVPGCRVDA